MLITLTSEDYIMFNKIRLKKIKINNLKNILSSEIEFEKKEYKSVTGIYGSNGSGKTAVIDSIDILKRILSADPIIVPFYYVNVLEKKLKLSYTFEYDNNNQAMEIICAIEFSKVNNAVVFSKELLTCKINGEIIHTIKIDRMASSVKKGVVVDKKEYDDSLFDFEKLVNRYSVGIEKSNSLIFGKLYECFNDNKKQEWLKDLTTHFFIYAKFQMFVIKVKESSKISANDEILFHISIQNENSVTVGIEHCNLLADNPIEKEHIEDFKTAIGQCNKILSVIIPNFEIHVNESEGEVFNQYGKVCKNVSFDSVRGENIIPLVYESDGIKKLISIVSSLISCYNNKSTLVAIDELDGGVYEYLLGQIVQVISNNGKGQLIFTSHNLRVLEVIDCNSIVFSTLNPNNRFIKFTNCKPTNNLRNLYLRALQIGGQKEELYKPMDNVDLKIAFKQANVYLKRGN